MCFNNKISESEQRIKKKINTNETEKLKRKLSFLLNYCKNKKWKKLFQKSVFIETIEERNNKQNQSYHIPEYLQFVI